MISELDMSKKMASKEELELFEKVKEFVGNNGNLQLCYTEDGTPITLGRGFTAMLSQSAMMAMDMMPDITKLIFSIMYKEFPAEVIEKELNEYKERAEKNGKEN